MAAADALTRSDPQPAGNGRAVAAAVLGVLATATMPLAILATRYSGSYELLHAGVAIPVAVVLGAGAIGLARGALRVDDMRLGRAGGRRTARLGRALGVLGISLGATCAVALAVYGILTYLGER
ncbi:MAG TPA: hypothetical protein VFJ60_13625 [Gaiella sp.]|nr:hypothetical protein [Gaiella sp.]